MAKYAERVVVVSQGCLCDKIYDLVLKTDNIALDAKAGQFVSLYCDDGAHLLPRPISLCGIDRENKTIRLVYRVVGYGTEEFSRLKPEMTLRVVGPLGNGFSLSDKPVILAGGGIGIPPMLEMARSLHLSGMKKEDIQIVLGYRDVCFLADEFKEYGTVTIATEDGSVGVKGNVLDAIRQKSITGEVIYACGPSPMLRAIKAYSKEQSMEAYLSLEERMACGIGACLGCVCTSKDVDHHSYVKNKRVCADGPVFNAKEVEL